MLLFHKNQENVVNYVLTDYLGNKLAVENIDEINFYVKECPSSKDMIITKQFLEPNPDGSVDITISADDTANLPVRPFNSLIAPYVVYFDIIDLDGNVHSVIDWMYLDDSAHSGNLPAFEVEQKPQVYYCLRGDTLTMTVPDSYPTLIRWIEVRKWWDDIEPMISKTIDSDEVELLSSETTNFDGRYVYTIYASADPENDEEPRYVIEKGLIFYKLFL